MADEELSEEVPAKRSKMPMIIALVLALLGGGAAFFATSTGMVLGQKPPVPDVVEKEIAPIGDVAFLAMEPLVINLAASDRNTHLRFRAHLEVQAAFMADVEKVLPRVVDVLNSYLRAVSVTDLEDPASLITLRAQMLRRVQLVTGEGRVKDLLIMEFVLT